MEKHDKCKPDGGQHEQNDKIRLAALRQPRAEKMVRCPSYALNRRCSSAFVHSAGMRVTGSVAFSALQRKESCGKVQVQQRRRRRRQNC
jgi:hypothetical protein